MTRKINLSALVILTLLGGIGGAVAQTAGPDEAVTADGAVSQALALTPAQKNAIYNAVVHERVRSSAVTVSAAIGAPVPPAVELRALPDQVAADNPWVEILKYAFVENTIVVVDPIRMRVVDVIHHGAQP
jgi:hypothetical protein